MDRHLYSIRRNREHGLAKQDEFGSKDMKGMDRFLENAKKLRVHRHVFCFSTQFALLSVAPASGTWMYEPVVGKPLLRSVLTAKRARLQSGIRRLTQRNIHYNIYWFSGEISTNNGCKGCSAHIYCRDVHSLLAAGRVMNGAPRSGKLLVLHENC